MTPRRDREECRPRRRGSPLLDERRRSGSRGPRAPPNLPLPLPTQVLIGGNEATYQTNLWVEHGNFPWYAYPAIPVLSFTHPVWTFLQINKARPDPPPRRSPKGRNREAEPPPATAARRRSPQERQHNLTRTRALSLQEWWLYCFQNNAGDSDGDGMPDYADEEHNP